MRKENTNCVYIHISLIWAKAWTQYWEPIPEPIDIGDPYRDNMPIPTGDDEVVVKAPPVPAKGTPTVPAKSASKTIQEIIGGHSLPHESSAPGSEEDKHGFMNRLSLDRMSSRNEESPFAEMEIIPVPGNWPGNEREEIPVPRRSASSASSRPGTGGTSSRQECFAESSSSSVPVDKVMQCGAYRSKKFSEILREKPEYVEELSTTWSK